MTRTVATLLVALLALAAVLLAFKTVHGHDIYQHWKTRNGVSCCDNRDCAPATAWTDEQGRLVMRQNGRTYIVPPQSILPIPSPDGRSHACVIGDYVICAVVGEIRT